MCAGIFTSESLLRRRGEGVLYGSYARSGGAQSATARSAGRSLVSWSLAKAA